MAESLLNLANGDTSLKPAAGTVILGLPFSLSNTHDLSGNLEEQTP